MTQTLLPDTSPANDNDNPRTTIDYDALGRKVAETDPMGRITRYAYDTLGRLEKVVLANPTSGANPALVSGESPAGSGTLTTRYSYDELGNNRTQVTTAQQTVGYTFDELDRLKTVTPSLGGGATYTYDAVGNRKTVTHANNVKTTYTYNERNHLMLARAKS